MAQSCFVCCELFNKSNRKQVNCPNNNCDFLVCKTCVREYLLSQKDPHCMNCKQGWNEQFIISQTNKSFFNTEYKKTRKQFLLESEISKIPGTMEKAENYKLINEETSAIKEVDSKIRELNKELNKLKENKRSKQIKRFNLIHGTNKEKKQFIMPCPHNECRGFLSSQYKCEICKLYTCPTCHEIIGYNKTDHHACNESSVKSAELIKKDTKPCPNCGIRIFKISGCDQMWCTECEVTFSWNSGSVLTNVHVHNPHFYERQRQINKGVIPREPGDVVCGGLCSYYQLRTFIISWLSDNEVKNKVSEWHRFIGHITNIDLLNTRQKLQFLNNNEHLRVRYIVGEISKEELSKTLLKNDAIRKKIVEFVNIFELLSVVGIESFAFLVNQNLREKSSNEIVKIIDKQYNHYIDLIQYCNDQFKIISVNHSCLVPQISKKFNTNKIKYSFKDLSEASSSEASSSSASSSSASCSYL